MDYVERFVRRGCAADEGAAVLGKYTTSRFAPLSVLPAAGGDHGETRNVGTYSIRFFEVNDIDVTLSSSLTSRLPSLSRHVSSVSRRALSLTRIHSVYTLLQYDRIRFGVSCAARYRVSVSEVSNEEKGGQSDADRMGVRVG